MAAAAVRRGPAPGAPPAGAEGGRRSLARWGCAAAAGLALVHFGPELAALAAHGSARHVPGPVGLRRLWEAGLRDRPRQLGGTRFARAEAYLHGPSGRSGPVLPEGSREAYQAEGYLVLRGVLPAATVEALRDELLREYSFEFEKNAHMDSDALLDFLVFGPLGQVARQLLGDDDVHLLRSVHHFRPTMLSFQRVSHYHYDWLECDDDLPAVPVSPSLLKFNVALYDDMPALWLLNQSSFEAMLLRHHNASFLSGFRAGPSGPPLPEEAIDSLSIRPVLSLGDAVVHSAALVHRSPSAAQGAAIGFVSPSYAARGSTCTGRSGSNRECHAGGPGPVRVEDAPWCFPLVRPAGELPGGAAGTLRAQFRDDFPASAWRRYLSSTLTRWLFLAPGRRAAHGPGAPVPPAHEVHMAPPSHGAVRGEGAGEAARARGGAERREDL